MSTDTIERKRGRPAAPIDPRLRDRRNEVARDLGRRRLRRLLLLLAVASMAVAAGLAVRSPLLDVDHVQVRGASHISAAEARTAAGIPLGRSMVSVDPAAAERRLRALPWVAEAKVARSWPGTIVVTLDERTPVAVVGEGSGAVLVDRDGRVLDRATDPALPAITGTGLEPGDRLGPRRRALARTLADLPADLRHDLASATVGHAGVRFVLEDDIVVVWGDPTGTRAKADAVLALLAQADRPTIARIDVSVPTAAAITRKHGGVP